MVFSLTTKQEAANTLLSGQQTHTMLFGGSRSGKTFLLVRAVIWRAIKAAGTRHAILRFRFNAAKASIWNDTLPKVLALAFPNITATMNSTDFVCKLANGSEIMVGGLDDKERTEKILGMEFATVYFNECSQIPWGSVETALTRLAQKADQEISGKSSPLRPRAYYDCNPPSKAHWSYRIFVEKRHPDTKEGVKFPMDYACMQINPQDNAENLAEGYIESNLASLSARGRKRFLLGEFADATPNQLFSDEVIDRWRVTDGDLPEMVRIVVAVDPSGAGDQDNADNDSIGIVVAGLGTNGIAYVMEDLTVKAGPGTWGRIATDAYDRHSADAIVAEINFGGAMVQHVIKTCRPRTNFIQVTASRGKVQRAEPFASLYDQGKVRHFGYLRDLEDELVAFSTYGYTGANSPNRADAAIWALASLFPGIVKAPKKPVEEKADVHRIHQPLAWMV